MSDPRPPGDSVYIHGTRPEEQRRLSRLNDLLNAACLRELAPPPGARVLDVGSGLGQFSRAVARAVGETGRVVGIERDPAQLARARDFAAAAGEMALVDFRAGDATALPLRDDEWGAFDLVHTRFVLEHVRDPIAVVQQMARAVRPGGRVVLADDDHEILRLFPELPGFDPSGAPTTRPIAPSATTRSSAAACRSCCTRPACVRCVSTGCFSAHVPAKRIFRLSSQTWPAWSRARPRR